MRPMSLNAILVARLLSQHEGLSPAAKTAYQKAGLMEDKDGSALVRLTAGERELAGRYRIPDGVSEAQLAEQAEAFIETNRGQLADVIAAVEAQLMRERFGLQSKRLRSLISGDAAQQLVASQRASEQEKEVMEQL